MESRQFSENESTELSEQHPMEFKSIQVDNPQHRDNHHKSSDLLGDNTSKNESGFQSTANADTFQLNSEVKDMWPKAEGNELMDDDSNLNFRKEFHEHVSEGVDKDTPFGSSDGSSLNFFDSGPHFAQGLPENLPFFGNLNPSQSQPDKIAGNLICKGAQARDQSLAEVQTVRPPAHDFSEVPATQSVEEPDQMDLEFIPVDNLRKTYGLWEDNISDSGIQSMVTFSDGLAQVPPECPSSDINDMGRISEPEFLVYDNVSISEIDESNKMDFEASPVDTKFREDYGLREDNISKFDFGINNMHRISEPDLIPRLDKIAGNLICKGAETRGQSPAEVQPMRPQTVLKQNGQKTKKATNTRRHPYSNCTVLSNIHASSTLVDLLSWPTIFMPLRGDDRGPFFPQDQLGSLWQNHQISHIWDQISHIWEMGELRPERPIAKSPDGDLLITAGHILTLKGCSWLCNIVIDAFFQHLMHGASCWGHCVLTVNSLLHKTIDGACGLPSFPDIKSDIYDYDIVSIPLHEKDHFTLVVLDVRQREIIYIDSLNPSRKNMTVITYIKKFLGIDKWEDKSGADVMQYCPVQTNNHDCGVFVCMSGWCFMFKRPCNFRQSEMQLGRLWIASVICQ